MASSITAIECGICLEEYSATRRPRTLNCGHNFCGPCLQNCIELGGKKCSVCRKSFIASKVEDIAINTDFEQVIQIAINTSRIVESCNEEANTSLKNESSDEEDDFSNGHCSRHRKSLLYFKCKTHNIYICRECTVIEHSPLKCEIMEIKEEVFNTKEETLQGAQQNMDQLESVANLLERAIEEMDDSISNKEAVIECLTKDIEEERKVRDTAQKDIVENKIIASQLKNSSQTLRGATTNKKIRKECSDLQDKLPTLEKLIEDFKLKCNNYKAKAGQMLIIDPASKIKYKGPFNEDVISYLKLTNPTERSVCFKVFTTAPKQYWIRPNIGSLKPHQATVLTTALQSFDYDPNKKYTHKFMVKALFAPEGEVKPVQLFKETDQSKIMEFKLDVVMED